MFSFFLKALYHNIKKPLKDYFLDILWSNRNATESIPSLHVVNICHKCEYKSDNEMQIKNDACQKSTRWQAEKKTARKTRNKGWLPFWWVAIITGEELHILTYSPSQCDHDIGLFSKSFFSLIGGFTRSFARVVAAFSRRAPHCVAQTSLRESNSRPQINDLSLLKMKTSCLCLQSHQEPH